MGVPEYGNINQKKYSDFNAFRIVTFGTAFGPAPYFGEDEYSGRMIVYLIQVCFSRKFKAGPF